MAETVEEPDGQVWRNLVTEEVAKVAETLEEHRGRHRYNLMDADIRAMYAEVPVIAQWDDHETTNDWRPGEVLDDEHCAVRDVDTLAARGRRAWQEYQPIADADDGAPLGRELEITRLLKALKDADVRNVVFLTADVHYCAAHHYSPERAASTDFTPFWEFAAGPIDAGSFGPNELDGTFGPEVVFHRAGRRANQSPRDGTSQYFGHVDLAEDDTFTVSLRDGLGDVVHSTTRRPE